MVLYSQLIVVGLAAVVAMAAAPARPRADTPTKTGAFKELKLAERSPLSSIDESFRRTPRQFTGQKFQTLADLAPGDRVRLDYEVSQESVNVVVPASARDGAPCGLLVWLGVTPPNPQWMGALAKRRVILVAPNRLDGRSPWLRRGLALDAVHNLSKQYNIDPARVYLGGFSAGAHAASGLIVQFPDVFRGTLCLMGGRYYRLAYDGPAKGKRPTGDATVLGPAWYGDVERLKQQLRLVSVLGGVDDIVPASDARQDHECLRLDGFQHTYIELAGQGHRPPDGAAFARALAALDAKQAKLPTTAPIRGSEPPHVDQVAQAKRLLTTAKMVYESLRRMPNDAKAVKRLPELAANDVSYDAGLGRRCLAELLASYPTTPAAEEGRGLLAKLEALPLPGLAGPSTKPAGVSTP